MEKIVAAHSCNANKVTVVKSDNNNFPFQGRASDAGTNLLFGR